MIDFDKIKSRRLKLALTLDEAAKRAGFLMPDGTPHKQRWCDLESGRRADRVAASTLRAVAKALCCSMESLMREAKAPG